MEENFFEDAAFENEIVYSPNVVEFVTVAGEYCGFVENVGQFSRKDFIDKSMKLLPLIYLKSSLLPRLDSLNEVVNEKFVAEYDWNYIKENISHKLGVYDSFVEVKDLMVQASADYTNLSISECFADIYQDLKDFISLYQMGNSESMQDGLWECKLNFEQIWGQRLLAILSSFHDVYFGVDEIEEEDEVGNLNQVSNESNNPWLNTFFEKETEDHSLLE